MKNPLITRDPSTGRRVPSRLLVYSGMVLVFLVCLVAIFTVPSSSKKDGTPQRKDLDLPAAINRTDPRKKMDIYQRQEAASRQQLQDGDLLAWLDLEESGQKERQEALEGEDTPDEESPADPFERTRMARQLIDSILEEFYNRPAIEDTGWVEEEWKLEAAERQERIEKERQELILSTYLERLEALERRYELTLEALEAKGSASGSAPSAEPQNGERPQIVKEDVTASASTTRAASRGQMRSFTPGSMEARPIGDNLVSGLGLAEDEEPLGEELIRARTASDQSLIVGELLEMVLAHPVRLASGIILDEGTRLYGRTSLQQDRLMVHVEGLQKGGRIYALSLDAYSPRDALEGLPLTDADRDSALRDVARRLAEGGNTSALRVVTGASSVLGMVVEDAARSVVQGTASYLSRSTQRKKVRIPAQMEILLR